MVVRRRTLSIVLLLTTAAVGLSSCSAGYVLRSAYYQAEMLGSRVPLDEARRSGRLTAAQLAALDRVDAIKAFGGQLGLKATQNYGSIALGWNRRMWNVSAC